MPNSCKGRETGRLDRQHEKRASLHPLNVCDSLETFRDCSSACAFNKLGRISPEISKLCPQNKHFKRTQARAELWGPKRLGILCPLHPAVKYCEEDSRGGYIYFHSPWVLQGRDCFHSRFLVRGVNQAGKMYRSCVFQSCSPGQILILGHRHGRLSLGCGDQSRPVRTLLR